MWIWPNTFQGSGEATAPKIWLQGWHVTVSHAWPCPASRLTWWPWPSPRPEWPSLTSLQPSARGWSHRGAWKSAFCPPGSGARGHADETMPMPSFAVLPDNVFGKFYCSLCFQMANVNGISRVRIFQLSNLSCLNVFWATLVHLIAASEQLVCICSSSWCRSTVVSHTDLWWGGWWSGYTYNSPHLLSTLKAT